MGNGWAAVPRTTTADGSPRRCSGIPLQLLRFTHLVRRRILVEHTNPVTTKGLAAPQGGVPVQRAAEGAGVNIPTMGRGFYLGGHLDTYTTPGWSITIYREYLKSMLEYTFPGYSNDNVNGLSNSVAGAGGVYRNITQGGIQNPGFTARADGILTYIPGFGDEGVLIALAGGTNETFVSALAYTI